MFPWLGELLEPVFGPFRLLSSHLFLIVAGTSVSFALTFILLPRSFGLLPKDRGREHAVHSDISVGKPTGGGFVFVLVAVFTAALTAPLYWRHFVLLGLVVVAMVSGYVDDRSKRPWGEYLKGTMDFAIALAAAFILFPDGGHIWIPFTTVEFDLSAFVFVPLATIVIWLSINSTNCTDGVDGLSSTLVLLALISLAVFLYVVVGNSEISEYLLLPFYGHAASWAIMSFSMVGSLAAYLWFNAYPSKVLMGDAGSRALGFFIGVTIIVSGNPFLILITSSVMLVNGGTGILKVALIRFARIKVFKRVRFPLHDHFRHTKGWSNAQVLVRFALVQILIIIVMFGIFVKVR